MSAKHKGAAKEHPLRSSDEIRHLVGPIADHTVVAILETGATIADLEAALIYARGEGNYIDRLGHPMTGKVAQVADILANDDLYTAEDER